MKYSSMKTVSAMFLILLTVLSMAALSSQQVPNAPTGLSLTSSASEITIEWSQPSSSAAVDNYTLFYSYVFRLCDGDIGGHMTVSGIPNNTRSYSLTQLEEFADYTIHLTASNQDGNSTITMGTITTQKAAPSSGVQNFSVLSVSPTSINITWDNVECRHRNSMINRFILFVDLVSTGHRVLGVKIEEINAHNHFLIDDLLPRTNYSIFLRADDDDPFIGMIFQGVPVILYEVTAVPESVGFLYNGRIYSNNSAVEISSFSRSSSLLCLTDLVQCCSSAETGSDPIGSWTLPSGSVPATSGTGIIMSAGPSTVTLTSTTNIAPPPSGVYSCEIEDASNVVRAVNLYVYPSGQTPSPPVISSLQYSSDIPAMVCVSTGQLIESVTWYKNGDRIQRNSSQFNQTQRIISRGGVVLEHSLRGNSELFLGTFTCAVQDNAGRTAESSVTINGVNILHSPLPLMVGSDETLTCVSEVGVADRIEWTINGSVLASELSVDQLNLTFSPVNDTADIHGHDLVCSVHLSNQIINQTLPVTVAVPHPPIHVSIVSSGSLEAGSEYNLTCVVTKLYTGLTRSPGVSWTSMVNTRFSSNDSITSITENISMATARFNPVYTEDSGAYICEGTLESPLLAAPVAINLQPFIMFQIPAPVVEIPQTQFTTNGNDNVTLTCSAIVNRTFINFGDLKYIFTWWRGSDQIFKEEKTLDFSQLTLHMPEILHEHFTCMGRARDTSNRILASTTTNYTQLITISVAPSCLKSSISVSLSEMEIGHNLICVIRRCPYLASVSNLTQISVDWTEGGLPVSNENTSAAILVGENEFLSVLPVSNFTAEVNYTCRATVPYAISGLNSQQILETEAFSIPATPLYIHFCSNKRLESNLSPTHRSGIFQDINNTLWNCSDGFTERNLRSVDFNHSTAFITFEALIVGLFDPSSIELQECLQDLLPSQISISSLSLEVVCTSLPCLHNKCDVPNTTPQILPTSQASKSSSTPRQNLGGKSTTDVSGNNNRGSPLAEIPSHIIAIVVVVIIVVLALIAAVIIIIVAYKKRPRRHIKESENVKPVVELNQYIHLYEPETKKEDDEEESSEIVNGLTPQVSSFTGNKSDNSAENNG